MITSEVACPECGTLWLRTTSSAMAHQPKPYCSEACEEKADNPDEMKPNAYAIFDPDGRLMIDTVRSSRNESWLAIDVHKDALQKAEYRCHPVRVERRLI